MASPQVQERIERIRQFNRFYTRQIGVLQKGFLQSPYSLTEVRVLYELANRDQPTATEILRELDLDASYLTRILHRFENAGLIARLPSKADARQSLLQITPQGQERFAQLNAAQMLDIQNLLVPLSETDQARLVEAMATVHSLLQPAEEVQPFILREDRPGDLGWIVYRHGILYAREYGWDARFEALVADIIAKFVRERDITRERCWIAERHGEPVGSVLLVKHTDEIAKLRLLLVEPSARGLGIGKCLVEECIAFAKAQGYHKIQLWTNSVLTSARRIYEAAGFQLIHEEPHSHFGVELIGQTWERDLS